MRIIFLLFVLVMLLGSCKYYPFPPAVNTKYVYYINYARNNPIHSLIQYRKIKILKEYVKYDKNGNEVELGEYGENWRRVVDEGGKTLILHGKYYKKLDVVTYRSYNDNNQLLAEEKWRFHNNQKVELDYREIYDYNSGQLISKRRYDEKGVVVDEIRFDSNSVHIAANKVQNPCCPFTKIRVNNDTIIYDTLGRITERSCYDSKGLFSRRTVIFYNDQQNLVTTLVYDRRPENLWYIEEKTYDFLTKHPIRKFTKSINASPEEKNIYEYNRKNLLKKLLIYHPEHYTGRDELRGYWKYKYKLY